MDRRFLTAREVAKILRTSQGQLANLRSRGEGPPYLKFNRKVLYNERELEKWISRYRVRTADSEEERL